MKFLSLLLSFAAIVAFGAICIAPMMREFMEGNLTDRAKDKIESTGKYSVASLKVDHFHAKHVAVSLENEEFVLNQAQVEKEIIDKIEPILGIYAVDCEVDLVSLDSKLAENKPKTPDGVVVEIPNPRPPPPGETPDLMTDKEPASFSILWDAKTQKLVLKGKQTNKFAGTELVKFFTEAKKQATVTSAIEIDNVNVANSKYLKRVLRDIRLIIINSSDDLRIDFQDAIKTSNGQKKGFLKFSGTTGTLEKYNALSSSIQNLVSVDFDVENDLVFYPYVSIRKDALKEKITLTGCVKDKAELAMLGSNAGREVTSNFSTDNKLETHARCLDIAWHDIHAESLIAKYMSKVAEGEIVYSNNKLTSLSGVSYDSDYVDEVKQAFQDKNITRRLVYKEAPRKRINLVEPEPAKPETLAEQLDEYKIYFGSGKYTVDPRYDPQLVEISQKIKSSTDKTSKIVIGGYADKTGSLEQNKRLSLKRARAVMSKLVAKGVDAKRIQVEFFGSEANGRTKAESRRVEIKVRTN